MIMIYFSSLWKKSFHILSLLLLSTIITNASLTITNPGAEKIVTKLDVVYLEGHPYFSIKEYAQKNNLRVYERRALGKKVLYFRKAHMKVTAESPFVMLDKQMKKMNKPAIVAENELYVPVFSFLDILKKNVFNRMRYTYVPPTEKIRMVINQQNEIVEKEFDTDTSDSKGQKTAGKTLINSVAYQEKENGITIRLNVEGECKDENLSGFFRKSEWFYLTVYQATTKKENRSFDNSIKSIEQVDITNEDKSSLFAFKLNKNFVDKDIYYSKEQSQIVVSLFSEMDRNDIKEISWKIDKIVLDPGHGGKDPGAMNPFGPENEKAIVLDIAKRLGGLLEENTDIDVVYTRKSDKFVPLWKRTKIANKKNGKLFLSFHVNAYNSSNVKGLEVFLLRPGKNEEAIRVAKQENAAIEHESQSSKEKYENYQNNILANMLHTANMKDSEKLAKIMNENYQSELSQKVKDVRQAGFYVLVGASMPKLLLELGYVTNRQEAYKLGKDWYRQRIAEATFQSIVEFKNSIEQTL